MQCVVANTAKLASFLRASAVSAAQLSVLPSERSCQLLAAAATLLGCQGWSRSPLPSSSRLLSPKGQAAYLLDSHPLAAPPCPKIERFPPATPSDFRGTVGPP